MCLMMDWSRQLTLILLIKTASSATINTTSVKPTTITTTTVTPTTISLATVTPIKNEELKTSRVYEVTENIKDVPDIRTLPPIIPNFGVVRPLNFGNNAVVTNMIDKNKSKESSEENTDAKNEGTVKKNSFSILHIKAEYDDKPPQNNKNVLSKVFGGIKDYVYHVKKGVVDGLHKFFHHHDDDIKPVKEPGFHDKPNNPDRFSNFYNKFPIRYDKFHRNFDDVEDFSDEHDDESNEYFEHY